METVFSKTTLPQPSSKDRDHMSCSKTSVFCASTTTLHLKAMFENVICYMLQVGVLDIKNTDSNLCSYISELNSTIGKNAVVAVVTK